MQNINVNIVPDSYPQTIRYSQGDVGREFKINVVGFTIPTGATVKIQATKPSGFGFSVAGTVDGNAVSFTTTAIMTDEAGRFPAELEITKDSVVIGTANFIMWGEANPHPEGTTDGQQGTIIPELTLLVERVEAAASSVLDMEVVATTLPAGSQATYSYDEDLNKATFGIPQGEAGAGAAGVVADAYSSSKTYKVGDYVLHNSNLYRCTTAITTAEAFTAAHWTQVAMGDEVADLKTDLDEYADIFTGDVDESVKNWLDEHPEATTTVEDGAVTLAKLNVEVLEKLRFSFISNKTLTPQNGYFVYDGCTINDLVAETELTGKHIFNNCTIGTLFVKGGEYEFHNCTFTFIRLYNSTGEFIKCVGNSIELTGACHNTVIDGCTLTADTQAPIIINGSVADNVRITNNTITNNKSDVLTSINAECINTHGISNSIIDNNYLVINTEKIAIDISGHKGSTDTAIRSFNNIVSNNIIESGDIEIYASKNLKVIGNKCRRINIEGDYQSEDYGEVLIEGNVITDRVSWHPTSGTPSAMNVRVVKNTISGRAFEAYYAIPSSVKVYVLGNTIKGIAVLTNDIAKDLIMNEHLLYLAPSESAYIPQCLVTANDGLTGITADTWFNGGIITNGEAENRYVKYRQINTHNGQALWWTQ